MRVEGKTGFVLRPGLLKGAEEVLDSEDEKGPTLRCALLAASLHVDVLFRDASPNLRCDSVSEEFSTEVECEEGVCVCL